MENKYLEQKKTQLYDILIEVHKEIMGENFNREKFIKCNEKYKTGENYLLYTYCMGVNVHLVDSYGRSDELWAHIEDTDGNGEEAQKIASKLKEKGVNILEVLVFRNQNIYMQNIINVFQR